jgi:hypothetical protein
MSEREEYTPDDEAREKLVSQALNVLCNASNFPRPAQPALLGLNMRPLAEAIADELIGCGWRPPARTVSTVEELDALADGTVIRDIFGATWTLYEGLDDGIDPDDPTNYRWAIGLNGNYPTYVTDLPATVLYEPEGE